MKPSGTKNDGSSGTIVKVAGPLVIAEGMDNARMFDMVIVSDKKLIGEIIELKNGKASIQVYEETSGIGPGEPVVTTGAPLSVELGPGLIESFYDGIQRPLKALWELSGHEIARGLNIPGLDRKKKWSFEPVAKKGDKLVGGDVIGSVKETILVDHKIMVPPLLSGKITEIKKGDFTVEEVVAVLEDDKGEKHDLKLMQKWPVRIPRPIKEKLAPKELLITGQRVVDTFFPIVKGGTACVPGPFGSGKTVIQHQFAKWADAQVVVYVGCGERGNEMTDVLMEFPELKDPHSGEPLMKRTVLVANTSNMPVAAREASVYTGITLAEYFRDMGYSVAILADSTSRWAESMREMSGRLEEMPGDEGYPAYMGTRIAEFYERAGRVSTLCNKEEKRFGAISVVGAVSPPGGDLSDPVVQSTLRVVKVFWGLQDKLAYKRHFPAISWLDSYSLYHDDLVEFFAKRTGPEWSNQRKAAMRILQEESELEEIVQLIGLEALGDRDRLKMETARTIREDFLHQNAFDPVDTYTSIEKQSALLKIVLHFHKEGTNALDRHANIADIISHPLREEISRAKYIPEDEVKEKYASLTGRLTEAFAELGGVPR